MPKTITSTPFFPKLRFWHCAAALFIAVFSVYYGSLSNGRVMFDDEDANPIARPLAAENPVQLIKERFSYNLLAGAEILLTARHLRDLSTQADRLLFGNDPWGGHLINLCLHFLVVLAAFLVLHRLLGTVGWAFGGALVFALHPAQTESVVYLAGRRDLLYGLFFLLSFLSGMKYLDNGDRRSLLLCLPAWGLSLLAKQSAVTLPLVLLAYATFKRPGAPWKGRGAVFLLISTLFAAAYSGSVIMVLFKSTIARVNAPPEAYWYSGSAVTQLLTLPAIFWKALSLMAAPISLCADYSYLAIEPVRNAASAPFLLPAAGLLAFAALAAFSARRVPLAGFAAAWIVLTYLPVMPLFPSLHNSEVFAEHWLYLPVFGFAMLLASLAREFQGGQGRAVKTGSAVLVALFAARSAARIPDWKDAETLWAKTLRQQPRCLRALANSAVIEMGKGRRAEARTLLERALQVDARNLPALINMAALDLAEGDPATAKRRLFTAFRSPVAAHNLRGITKSLGTANFMQGRYGEAMKNFKFAAWLPRAGVMDLDAATSYARAAQEAGLPELAAAELSKVLAREPAYLPANKALGYVHLANGRPAEAVTFLEKAAADPEAQINLALAWTELREHRKALRYAEMARESSPWSYKAWLAQSGALRTAGRHRRALPYALRAVAISANHETLLELALVQRGLHDWGASFGTFEKALGIYPGDPELNFHLAGTLWENGQDIKAYNTLYNLLENHPTYAPAKNAIAFVRKNLEHGSGLALP
ncbi:MAG: glycosyltransferase family 39 protein [Elusimicrobia bacterium]|nr:glycosyltransferase family 39 protein [Elusimicrobiota bacterium]